METYRKTEIGSLRERERERERRRQVQAEKILIDEYRKGWASLGLRDQQRSVLSSSKGSQEAFVKQWFSPEDHSEEYIPL